MLWKLKLNSFLALSLRYFGFFSNKKNPQIYLQKIKINNKNTIVMFSKSI